jgi:hypothetical protein
MRLIPQLREEGALVGADSERECGRTAERHYQCSMISKHRLQPTGLIQSGFAAGPFCGFNRSRMKSSEGIVQNW